jgi:hypothetical protein
LKTFENGIIGIDDKFKPDEWIPVLYSSVDGKMLSSKEYVLLGITGKYAGCLILYCHPFHPRLLPLNFKSVKFTVKMLASIIEQTPYY